MYWANCTESSSIFWRNPEPIAKKEHKCCECGGTIKIGDRYSYFVGCWYDDSLYVGGISFGTYKTCMECEKDWREIVRIHHENGEKEACQIFGMLRDAVQEAFDEGYLIGSDRLVQKWLEVDISELSPEEKEEYERRRAVVQMKACSPALL